MKGINKPLLAKFLLGAFTLTSVHVSAAPATWTGANNSDMTDNNNWLPTAVPINENATFPFTVNKPILTGASQDYNAHIFTASPTITIDAGGVLNILGSGGVSVLTLASPSYTIQNGGILLINIGPAGNGGSNSQLTYQLKGDGDLSFLGTGQTGGMGVYTVMLNGNNKFTTGTNPMVISALYSDDSSDLISLGALLTLEQYFPFPVTFDVKGVITNNGGNAGGIIKKGVDTLALYNSGNSYGSSSVGTTIQEGDIQLYTNAKLGVVSAPLVLDGGLIGINFNTTLPNPIQVTSNNGDFDTKGFHITSTGALSGTGLLTKYGSGILELTDAANASFAGTIHIAEGVLKGTTSSLSIPSVPIQDDGILQFSQGAPVLYSSNISGTGSVLIDSGTDVTYSGTNTYLDGTHISGNSSLTGQGQNMPQTGVIDLAAAGDSLNFVQTVNGAYAGTITGLGVVNTSGAAKLSITGISNAFAGTSNLNGVGEVYMAPGSVLGGNVNLIAGSLSGYGQVSTPGFTTTVSGGVIRPGASIGTLSVGGDYHQTGGEYEVELNNLGNVAGVNNDFIQVYGKATLASPAYVHAISSSGGYYIGGRYRILSAVEGLTGTYNSVVQTTNLKLIPELSYDANSVYLDFRDAFYSCAYNRNGQHVAEQLFTIEVPNAEEQILLTNITSLECPDIGEALDQLSGSQYSSLMLSNELSVHQFVRRLFDPVRSFLAQDSCCIVYDYCHSMPGEVWMEGGGVYNRFKNSNSAYGFKNKGYQFSAGVQTHSDTTWLGGAAITFEHTDLDFKIGGSGYTNTVLGALYGVYRYCDFYLLGDVVFGGTSSKIHRSFYVNEAHYKERAKPEALEGMVYLETGLNYNRWMFEFAPFIGFEGGYFGYRKFHESGDEPVALSFTNRSYGTFDTRVGIHIALDENCCGVRAGVDIAWQYRCTDLNDYLDVHFQEFGHDFRVQGVSLGRNSLEMAANVEKSFNDTWTLFATANWRRWSNSDAYDVLGGVTFSW